MKVDLYNPKNEVVGTMDVSDKIFAARWNASLVSQVLLAHSANQRKPWAHAKDRSEVRGGGKKPWRQKGTGRARHGSIRSPLWIGGGKAHGPLKDRDYSQKVNKKMKQAALFSVLSRKLKDHDLLFLKDFSVSDQKTKTMTQALAGFAKHAKTKRSAFNLLLVPNTKDKQAVARATSNLEKVKVSDPRSLNVYDILKHQTVLIDEQAVSVIEGHYHKKK